VDIIGFIWLLYNIYFYIILIYVLMSWLPAVRESAVGEFLGKLVEPYLRPFRRLIPPIGGILDISPIIALIALRFVAAGLEAIVQFFMRL
jgi:uncharacterized protein YggT (Ycf19 family)